MAIRSGSWTVPVIKGPYKYFICREDPKEEHFTWKVKAYGIMWHNNDKKYVVELDDVSVFYLNEYHPTEDEVEMFLTLLVEK